MKQGFYLLVTVIGMMIWMSSCRTHKKITKIMTTKDTTAVVITNRSATDSIEMVKKTLDDLLKKKIDFKTFSAKIKVDYEDSKGKQPDVNAYVRILKDSLIWVNIRLAFLDVDLLRVLIRTDSVFVVNKHEKLVQLRSMDYLQEVTQIPFDFKTLQDLLVGNPVFIDNNIVSYKKNDNQILMAVVGQYFKHLLTIDASSNLLLHSKLDDVDVGRNRTADITYDEFEYKAGLPFPTKREITVAEKTKLDIKLNYKQYEFNKDLTISFSLPKNYKYN
jgi:hypothetical protein